jgi:hypothetical protein
VVTPTPIKIVVADDNRIAVVTDRTPTDVVVSTVPVDPCWTPRTPRDPVPPQTKPPVPSAIMADAPSPRRIGNPGPATDWVPQPSSIVIRSPGMVVDLRHPYITIRGLINPITIGGKFRFIFIEFSRKIRPLYGPSVKSISGTIPLGKIVTITGMQIFGARAKSAIGCYQLFFRLHKNRALFARSFDRSLQNMDFCLAVFDDYNPIKSLFEDIKRGIRCMNFKILLSS